MKVFANRRQRRARGVRLHTLVNFGGGIDWLRENGVEVVDLHDERCIKMLGDWIAANPEVWNEDIGES